ncbi:hypothetical protein GCM10010413_10000 [Promicromonospora sukumoe]
MCRRPKPQTASCIDLTGTGRHVEQAHLRRSIATPQPSGNFLDPMEGEIAMESNAVTTAVMAADLTEQEVQRTFR